VGDVTRTARAGAYLERLDRVTFAAETNLITNDHRARALTLLRMFNHRAHMGKEYAHDCVAISHAVIKMEAL